MASVATEQVNVSVTGPAGIFGSGMEVSTHLKIVERRVACLVMGTYPVEAAVAMTTIPTPQLPAL